MIRWKSAARAVSLVLALSLTLSTATYAAVVPPLEITTQNTYQSGGISYGPGSAGNGNFSQPGNGVQVSYPSRLPSITAAVTTDSSSAQGPEKPTIQAQGAVLYDATNNQFLFEQNADTRYYPASITKLLTALLVLEKCNLNDVVTFSESAVTNLESGAVTLGVGAGDRLSVKDCLYGLLLKSANEIANGLAEHVSGSVSAFADLMNQKARSLGCTNTNFVNPNGLNNANHYTTARDMALIAKAVFDNPTLCQIDSTINYSFPPTSKGPTVRNLTMGHKMLNPANTAYYYPGVIGGKTGYTSLAGNTLVTCAERDGVRLIVVILKSRQSHYTDTKALLDYGFALVKSGSVSGGTNTGSQGPGGGSGSGSFPGSGSGSVPGGNSGPGGPGGGSGGPGGQSAHVNRWEQDSRGWRFVKANGSYAKNECMMINNEIYCFMDDQYMVSNSWYAIGGIWYFFRPSGGMAKSRWIQTNGYWYYADGNGSLAIDTTTPDGYKVDGNGVWVQ